jgi:hypothetical protein
MGPARRLPVDPGRRRNLAARRFLERGFGVMVNQKHGRLPTHGYIAI